jgi:hypothetical protein
MAVNNTFDYFETVHVSLKKAFLYTISFSAEEPRKSCEKTAKCYYASLPPVRPFEIAPSGTLMIGRFCARHRPNLVAYFETS